MTIAKKKCGGWGRFQYMKDGEAVQDSVGHFIAEAINEKIAKDNINGKGAITNDNPLSVS